MASSMFRSFGQVHRISVFLLMCTGLMTVHRCKLGWQRSKLLCLVGVFWSIYNACIVVIIFYTVYNIELSYAEYCMLLASVCQYTCFMVTVYYSVTHQNETIAYFKHQEYLIPKYPRITLSLHQQRFFVIPTIFIYFIITSSWHEKRKAVYEIILRSTCLITPILYDYYIISVTAPLIHLARKISRRIQNLIKESRGGGSCFTRVSMPMISSAKLFSKKRHRYQDINIILFNIEHVRQLTGRYNKVRERGIGRENPTGKLIEAMQLWMIYHLFYKHYFQLDIINLHSLHIVYNMRIENN